MYDLYALRPALFWAFFRLRVLLTDLQAVPARFLQGVAHASPSIYVAGGPFPPVGVQEVTL